MELNMRETFEIVNRLVELRRSLLDARAPTPEEPQNG
jgi:hypothetical protein